MKPALQVACSRRSQKGGRDELVAAAGHCGINPNLNSLNSLDP